MSMQIIYTTCRLCGRKLKSAESQILGFGPTCYSHYKKQHARKKKLIDFDGEHYDEVPGGLSKQ